jgi:AraC-like DNA-binding protein
MGALEDVLAIAGVRGSMAAPIDAGERWGLTLDAVPEAAFHAITEGVAYLTVPGAAPQRMMAGDVALLPRGSAHTFASDRDAPLEPFDRLAYVKSRQPGDVLELGPQPVGTRVLCAFYSHNATTSTPLFDLLPEVIFVPAAAGNGQVAATIKLLSNEVSQPGVASSTILDRLIDVLLIQVLRTWLQTNTFSEASWLRGLADPVIAPVMAAMHAEPGRDWDLDELAAVAHVSRATLSRKFTSLVGVSPSAYLTSWRMDVAAQRLRDTDEHIHDVARAVGYTSEFAFSRAFSRAFDQPPTRYRTSSRSTPKITRV